MPLANFYQSDAKNLSENADFLFLFHKFANLYAQTSLHE